MHSRRPYGRAVSHPRLFAIRAIYIMEKQTVNSNKEMIKEIKRHFDVVIEDVKGEIKIIAEQYTDVKKTLNSHTELLNSHTELLNSHTEMIGSMAEDIAVIKTDVEFIKSALKKKVDYDEFAALERRMSLVESKIRR